MPRSRRAGIARGVADSLGVGIGIFAGSVELLLVSLLAATTPILTIAVTVLAMNFRHVFYALSFPLDRVSPGIPRAYSVYALIDEAYATYVLLPAGQLSSARIVTGQLLMQAYWVAGGLLGVALAGILPARLEGLEFALVALFVVMTLDAARSRNEVPSLLLAGLSVGVALLAFPGQALPAALIVYTALLALRFVLARGSDDGPDGDVSSDGPSGGSRDGGSGGAVGSATDGARRGDPGSAASGADA